MPALMQLIAPAPGEMLMIQEATKNASQVSSVMDGFYLRTTCSIAASTISTTPITSNIGFG